VKDTSDQTLSEIPLSSQDSTIPKFSTQNENEYDIHDPEIAFESESNCVKYNDLDDENMEACYVCNQLVHYLCSNVNDNKKYDFNKFEYACRVVYEYICVRK
jgi:hypothetical protein